MTDILLIDNHDSFTHLLADLVQRASGITPRIVANDAPATQLRLDDADLIIISPGPGEPTRANLKASAVALDQDHTPVIGVCLGHQAIAFLAGAGLRRAPFPMHGLESLVQHSSEGIFAGLPQPLPVIRYHSLDVAPHPDIEVLATAEDGTIMALKHRHKPQWGVQFHPESIGTHSGVQLMQNLLAATGIMRQWHRSTAPLHAPAEVAAGLREHFPYVCWFDTATADTATSGMHLVAAGQKLIDVDSIPPARLSPDSSSGHTFVPGALGVLSYEASDGTDGGTFTEQLLQPEVVYQIVDGQAFLLSPDDARLTEVPLAVVAPARIQAPVRIRHSRQNYRELVEQCQAEIAAGNSYELCLTTSAHAEVDVDPLALYLQLRQVSPSPMAGCYLSPQRAVLSASPERFLSVRQSVAAASPIKGTRPRGQTPESDRQLAEDLATSRKDRAENLMIVDLLRNDLARTCTDIAVPELCAVHSFTHAHQMISTITGRIAPGRRTADVVRLAFPGGSMTGAPKQSSMDILARLEGQPRGDYSGIMGYISADGDADFSILIRTLVLADGRATYGAGGAITRLSDADEEYDEVLVKLRPFLAVLGNDDLH
ncbi:chorismate-binding protein [Corynebacterium epidermidicanis]|uniref:chorismate-binding protein n=1 Tax=Corynebacterium epidermidicanis TaxID=1050174 RepID=UPI000699F553|nr:chorismate-binding protein [Corynebacterium epidermidicanis]